MSGPAEIRRRPGPAILQISQPGSLGIGAAAGRHLSRKYLWQVAHISIPVLLIRSWAQWLRLPCPIPLIWWALLYTRR